MVDASLIRCSALEPVERTAVRQVHSNLYHHHNHDDDPQGDSGGPFTVKNRETNKHDLVGVVSWGDGCAAVRVSFLMLMVMMSLKKNQHYI